jgi:hypothetical protein
MAQPLCRNFIPFPQNGYVNSRYPSPMRVSETVYLCIYQLFATERKIPGSCIYLNYSELLKVKADKNKMNIVFSYSFGNIHFIFTSNVLVMVCVCIWQKLKQVSGSHGFHLLR